MIFWVIHFVQLIVQRSRNDHIIKPKVAIYGPKEVEENEEKTKSIEEISQSPIISYKQLFLDGIVPFSLHFSLGKLTVQFNPHLFVETPSIILTNIDKRKTLLDLSIRTNDMLIYSNTGDGGNVKRNIFEGGNINGELSLDVKRKMIIKSNVKISKIILGVYPDTVFIIFIIIIYIL